MANSHSLKLRASFPKQLANWANSAGGLDLTLRLIHALSLIAAEICVDDVIVEKSIIATEQLGLGESLLVPGYTGSSHIGWFQVIDNHKQRGDISVFSVLSSVSSMHINFLLGAPCPKEPC